MKLAIFYIFILTLCISYISNNVYASQFEFTLAANYTGIDGHDATGGLSTRVRYLRFDKKTSGTGLMFMSNFRGHSIINADLIAAYGIRGGGKSIFWEAGAGVKYHLLWGPGLAIVLGSGIDLGGKWYIAFPIIYRHSSSIEFTPYLGMNF